MGNYRIVINAVGGHGQDRTKGDGETVDFEADNESSPEAIVKRAVEELRARGESVTEATVSTTGPARAQTSSTTS